ncbi:flavodoxin [Clostridioides difficile]
MSKKNIVLYFSSSSNTKRIAEIIQKYTLADIQELFTETPYTKDYNALVKQAQQEIQKGIMPSIKKISYDLSDYDTIFLGTPNWWSTIAPPIATLLNQNNLSGKNIIPFITHGGGGKGHADKDIKKLCPNSKVLEIFDIYGNGGNGAEEKIISWLKRINMHEQK